MEESTQNVIAEATDSKKNESKAEATTQNLSKKRFANNYLDTATYNKAKEAQEGLGIGSEWELCRKALKLFFHTVEEKGLDYVGAMY